MADFAFNNGIPANDDQSQICLLADPDRGLKLHLLDGAVNTVVVQKDSDALLINCCDSITGDRLAGIQISSVAAIALTQHTRLHQAGRTAFPDARLIMPEASFRLLDQNRDYWQAEKWRYHLYYFTPGRHMPVIDDDFEQFRQKTMTLISGQTFEFHDLIVQTLATPGPADDSMTYVFEWPAGNKKTMKIACCGDLMVAGSRLWELFSLQKGFGDWTDYHGFLGRCGALMMSLRQLQSMNLDLILPAHGPAIINVNSEIELLLERLINLFNHYAAISSMHYYCPDWLSLITAKMPKMDAARLAAPVIKASQYPLPAFIRYISLTSFGLYSADGSVLLFDCGDQSVIQRLEEQLAFGAIRQVEACLVTHYHDDHVDSLRQLQNQLGCPVYCLESMTRILEQPQCYDLPCLSPQALKIDRSLKHGETWRWHEYQITAFHFPGQTLYHGAYLVQGHQQTIFFIGDSFSPRGIDDYCAGNRNFLAEDRGFLFCLSLIRRLSPDFLINAHQGQMFSFTEEEIDKMISILSDRKQLIAELTPWQAPDFAVDPFWVRPNSFDHYTKAGEHIKIGIEWTNHSAYAAKGEAEIIMPPDWQSANRYDALRCAASIPAMTCGLSVPVVPGDRPDAVASVSLYVPEHASGIYVLPLRITWQGRYLGQWTQVRVIVG